MNKVKTEKDNILITIKQRALFVAPITIKYLRVSLIYATFLQMLFRT